MQENLVSPSRAPKGRACPHPMLLPKDTNKWVHIALVVQVRHLTSQEVLLGLGGHMR